MTEPISSNTPIQQPPSFELDQVDVFKDITTTGTPIHIPVPPPMGSAPNNTVAQPPLQQLPMLGVPRLLPAVGSIRTPEGMIFKAGSEPKNIKVHPSTTGADLPPPPPTI
jgi:hypothetical protein